MSGEEESRTRHWESLAGQKLDEGSFRGNRQNVFERGCSGGKRILRSDLQNRG